MLSLLRGARRLPGIRLLVPHSVNSNLASSQVSRQSRLLGTLDLCIHGWDEPSRRDAHHRAVREEGAQGVVHPLPIACTAWGLWRWASPVGKWEESALSLKVAKTAVQGARRVAAALLSPWAAGSGQPTLLPQPLQHDQQGYEEEGEEMKGIFGGGLWATSVRRKRVTKMRKHKWRKRRKLERQSASRRVNK